MSLQGQTHGSSAVNGALRPVHARPADSCLCKCTAVFMLRSSSSIQPLHLLLFTNKEHACLYREPAPFIYYNLFNFAHLWGQTHTHTVQNCCEKASHELFSSHPADDGMFVGEVFHRDNLGRQLWMDEEEEEEL